MPAGVKRRHFVENFEVRMRKIVRNFITNITKILRIAAAAAETFFLSVSDFLNAARRRNQSFFCGAGRGEG